MNDRYGVISLERREEFVKKLVAELNSKIASLCKINNYTDFRQFASRVEKGQETQKLTILLSFFYEDAIENAFNSVGVDCKLSDVRYSDRIVNNKTIEFKMSLKKVGFTGVKHAINKRSLHLFIKPEIEKVSVTKLFIAVVDLDLCPNTPWKGGDTASASYTDLKFSVLDADKLDVIHGNILKKIKWAEEIRLPV